MKYSVNSLRGNLAVVMVLLTCLSPSVDSAEQPKSCTWSDTSAETGFFTSPNFPSHYGNDEDCELTLTSPEGTSIRFEAKLPFNTETCGECKCDYLKFSELNPATNLQMVTSWCGLDQPEPYVSKTSRVKLEFHSDKYQTYGGFNVTWKHVERTCGDSVKGSSGVVEYSPDFFKGFNSCKWDIEVEPGKQVQFDLRTLFGQAITEEGDALEVLDYPLGQPMTSRGRWSKGDRPPSSSFTSFGSKISLLITKNNTVAMETGDAQWNAVDECGRVYTEPEGFIVSPENQTICTWDIETPREHHAVLVVTKYPRLRLAFCRLEIVQILDFSEQNNTYVRAVNNLCRVDTFPYLHSAGSKLRIAYNSSLDSSSLSLSWTTACGRILTDVQGTVSFPGGSDTAQYPPNKDCEWAIHAAKEHVIRLDFNNAFDLDTFNNETCDYDYVEVIESHQVGHREEESKSLGKFCGNNAPGRITSTSEKLLVRFHSDSEKQGTGFHFSWNSACGEVYNGTEGDFSSPKFPANRYPDNFDCRWEMQAPVGHVVQLEVGEHYSIEESENCDSDYLEIFDYSTTGELTTKGRWCGKQRPPLLTSVTSRMVAVFHSDSSKNGIGFQAHWKSVNIAAYDCGEVFTSPEGSFSSPGYPQPYPANRKCRWVINPPEGQRLKLSFDVLDLEMNKYDCSYDGVEVLGTLPNGKLISYGRWCSVQDIPDIYSMSKLVILFNSDATKNGQGFHASWTSDSECGGTIVGKAGHIVTPNFPSNYPEDIECKWDILTSKYQLTFDPRFELEEDVRCLYDYLSVYTPGGPDKRWCGRQGPPPINLTTYYEHMTFYFKSDKSITGMGFMATLS